MQAREYRGKENNYRPNQGRQEYRGRGYRNYDNYYDRRSGYQEDYYKPQKEYYSEEEDESDEEERLDEEQLKFIRQKQYQYRALPVFKAEEIKQICIDFEFNEDSLDKYFKIFEQEEKYKDLPAYQWQETKSREQKQQDRMKKQLEEQRQRNIQIKRQKQEELRRRREEERKKLRELRQQQREEYNRVR